jgi:hypothetical protein
MSVGAARRVVMGMIIRRSLTPLNYTTAFRAVLRRGTVRGVNYFCRQIS